LSAPIADFMRLEGDGDACAAPLGRNEEKERLRLRRRKARWRKAAYLKSGIGREKADQESVKLIS
jgi:hypothetical protein